MAFPADNTSPRQETVIVTDHGEIRDAAAPLIVSASRATDIPAFYGNWFLRRLDAGYARRANPFSGRPVYVSFRNTRLFVFWSKNPQPFLPLLAELDKRNLSYYFQVTVNDYGEEGLERCVPPLAERIATFKQLAGIIGRERVLWRFDPLLLTGLLTPERLLARIRRIGAELAGHTERLTVSFITRYAKVVRNLSAAGVSLRPWDGNSRETVLRGIGDAAREWHMRAVTCADGGDYGDCGIARGKCIDDELVARLAGPAGWREDFLKCSGGKKDPGQRQHCGCIASRDIGSYNSCGHGCVYCYANASPAAAAGNLRRHDGASDAIAG